MEMVGDLFSSLASILVIGVVNGTIYGLMGLGIVLLFKSQRVLNFAHAEIAGLAAFTLYGLHVVQGMPYLPALVLALLATLAVSLFVEHAVIRPLLPSGELTVFVATAGIALFIISTTLFVVGPKVIVVPGMFGGLEERLSFGGLLALLSPQRILLVVLLVATAVAITRFFRDHPLGRAILAMSAEPFAVRLSGVDVHRLSRLVWAIAGLTGGAAAITYAPTIALHPGYFTFRVLLPALTAVVIGGLGSVPGAFVGGIAVGVIGELGGQLFGAYIPAPDLLVVFVVLLTTLVLRPNGIMAKGAA